MVFVGRACAVTGGAGSVFLETKSTEITIPKADIAVICYRCYLRRIISLAYS